MLQNFLYQPCILLQIISVLHIILFLILGAFQAEGSPEIKLPRKQSWPSIACTSEELARLKAAYQSSGPSYQAVAEQIYRADEVLG